MSRTTSYNPILDARTLEDLLQSLLLSEASYGFQQSHNIHDIHDRPLLCDNEEGYEEIGTSYNTKLAEM
jgi:hypothetical protein